MKTSSIICVFCFILTSLTSCALTHSTQVINYQPNMHIENRLSSSKVVNVERLKDTRGYEDDKIIFFKKNLYNQTMSGAYKAEKPIVDILTDAIKDGFNKKNIAIGDNGNDYILKSELQKLDYEAISGFATATIIPEITVKFQLIDKDYNIVWTDIITGKASSKESKFERFLPPAIDNLVEQLINNPTFVRFLEN